MYPYQRPMLPGNWRKPRRSGQDGNCVEAGNGGGFVFVRDTKRRGGPVLAVTAEAWRSFAAKVKAG